MVRDKGLPIHREDVTVHWAHPGHRLVVQVEHLESIKWPKSTSMIVSSSLALIDRVPVQYQKSYLDLGFWYWDGCRDPSHGDAEKVEAI